MNDFVFYLSRKCRSLSTTLPLQFTMVCADTEIGLGLDSKNNNIRICITSGAAEIKKSRKRIFVFFLPKSRVGGFEKLFIKKLWPY